ncbi:GGDEF domain-containing protein [Hahella ganghwensis]|uniref:GGDEF domain-containing protein n=1 Tax=Hahella ganghwensis TaxID=286420 RepID=UPI0003A69E32|nr:GGDEF domain-containing protein [Hahella ganghwensis]
MPNSRSDSRKPTGSRLALAPSPSARQLNTEDLSHILVRKLQTTLETEQLITWFVEGVSPLLGDIRCKFESTLITVNTGTADKARHTASYNLTLEGNPLGQIEFQRAAKFTEEELASLEALLGCLIYPLRNSLHYHEAVSAAMTDALTGIGNKRSFDYQIHREVAQARRYGSILSLLVFDVDFFKSINDNYGHNAGDAVLKQLTKVVVDTCRDSDMIFRMGGEEFALLLPKTGLAGALTIAERIRESVAQTVFCYESQKISATISLGVACHEGSESRCSLMERTDKALYRAKHLGRNKSVIADNYQDLRERCEESADQLSI